MIKNLNLRHGMVFVLVFAFLLNSLGAIPNAMADDFYLPAPGQMVTLTPAYTPAVLKGIKLDVGNPFRFHFYVDTGDSVETLFKASNDRDAIKFLSTKLIKYFFASLTIPEKDLWVNLSPYEKDRIIPQAFGQTEMGRDLLGQDYILKQITASMIYPESKLGKEFWAKIYAQAQSEYGTTNIPVNTFNKVWIVPDKAVVYENGGTAFVLENHLKVMLEEDYLSLNKHECRGGPCVRPLNGTTQGRPQQKEINSIGSQVIRQIVIPALTKEVNEGKNFAPLRQVFYSLILATWYKKKIKDSILNKIYADQKKIGGVGYNFRSVVGKVKDEGDVDYIYQQYLKAFKKGVYNYIKEDVVIDPESKEQTIFPKKYFSGGVNADMSHAMSTTSLEDRAKSELAHRKIYDLRTNVDFLPALGDKLLSPSAAMKTSVDEVQTAFTLELQERLTQSGIKKYLEDLEWLKSAVSFHHLGSMTDDDLILLAYEMAQKYKLKIQYDLQKNIFYIAPDFEVNLRNGHGRMSLYEAQKISFFLSYLYKAPQHSYHFSFFEDFFEGVYNYVFGSDEKAVTGHIMNLFASSRENSPIFDTILKTFYPEQVLDNPLRELFNEIIALRGATNPVRLTTLDKYGKKNRAVFDVILKSLYPDYDPKEGRFIFTSDVKRFIFAAEEDRDKRLFNFSMENAVDWGAWKENLKLEGSEHQVHVLGVKHVYPLLKNAPDIEGFGMGNVEKLLPVFVRNNDEEARVIKFINDRLQVQFTVNKDKNVFLTIVKNFDGKQILRIDIYQPRVSESEWESIKTNRPGIPLSNIPYRIDYQQYKSGEMITSLWIARDKAMNIAAMSPKYREKIIYSYGLLMKLAEEFLNGNANGKAKSKVEKNDPNKQMEELKAQWQVFQDWLTQNQHKSYDELKSDGANLHKGFKLTDSMIERFEIDYNWVENVNKELGGKAIFEMQKISSRSRDVTYDLSEKPGKIKIMLYPLRDRLKAILDGALFNQSGLPDVSGVDLRFKYFFQLLQDILHPQGMRRNPRAYIGKEKKGCAQQVYIHFLLPFYDIIVPPTEGSAGKSGESAAMIDQKQKDGGIDLNPAQMSLQINKDTEDFRFNFNGVEMNAAQISGVKFIVRSMTPVSDITKILGP